MALYIFVAEPLSFWAISSNSNQTSSGATVYLLRVAVDGKPLGSFKFCLMGLSVRRCWEWAAVYIRWETEKELSDVRISFSWVPPQGHCAAEAKWRVELPPNHAENEQKPRLMLEMNNPTEKPIPGKARAMIQGSFLLGAAVSSQPSYGVSHSGMRRARCLY